MPNLSRRRFLQTTTAVGAASVLGFPSIVRARGLNEKLQVAFVAVGGRAEAHTAAAHKAGLQCVAFAEVDKTRWSSVLGKEGWGGAAGYTDWREVFQKHEGQVDVAFVSTPDHTHFAPTMTAISRGIHCYTEKPLTWSVKEAQLLAKAYAKNPGVVTQMGNQGNALDGWRRSYELYKAGAIGDVTEVHTWTDRPAWPQGGDRPDYTTPVPATLDWDAWVGPAPMRPYAGPKSGKGNGPYHAFNWRGYVDFGCGAMGDMACHCANGLYAILEPGYAASVEPVTMTGPVTDQYPSGMVIKSTFRSTADRPGFDAYWYEGRDASGTTLKPQLPTELAATGEEFPSNGSLVIGTEGKMYLPSAHWENARLLPATRHDDFGTPEQLLERSPGHHEEFFMACRGEKPREFSRSNFAYAGPMTANVLLGNLSARAGKKLELSPQGEVTSDPAVAALTWREPREGWGPLEMNL